MLEKNGDLIVSEFNLNIKEYIIIFLRIRNVFAVVYSVVCKESQRVLDFFFHYSRANEASGYKEYRLKEIGKVICFLIIY